MDAAVSLRRPRMTVLRGVALFCLVLFAGIALVAASFAAYDFVWGSPQPNELVYASAVAVSPEAVSLKGGTASSALHYRRYSVQLEDGRMNVMLRWSLLNSRGGSFDISIPTNGERVEEVYLWDGSDQLKIYP